MGTPLSVPAIQVTQLHSQNRRLNLVQSAIPTDLLATVLVTSTMVPKRAEPLRKLIGISDDHTPVAPCPEILAGIEANTAGIRQRARVPLVVGCTQRLGIVFDYVQSTPPSQFENGIHICRLAVKMDRNDGLGTFRDPACGVLR